MATADVTKLLRDLSAAGIQIWVSEGGLQYRAPAGTMTAEIRAAVAESKQEILTLLAGPKFHAREMPSCIPILRYHYDYWKQLQAGAFDIGFINGSFFVLKCRGSIDIELLKDRVARLAARHSILRARVVENDGVKFSFDQPHEALLKVIDLSCDYASQSHEVKAVADQLVWQAFDATAGPMARFFVVRLSENEHLLGMVVHHFICDGMSLEVLSRELLCGPSTQETPALQYSDYILAMNEWLDTGAPQLRMEYWKTQMRNAPATRLPPDFECDPDANAELNVDLFSVPANVASALSDLAKRKQTTLFTVVLAAKMSALACCVGKSDIVIIIQHHHRDNVNLLSVVGAITDRLPVRAQIVVEQSFEKNLSRVQQALQAAYAYDVPLSMLEGELSKIGASTVAPAINFLSYTAEKEKEVISSDIEIFPVTPASKHGTARKHAAHWMTAYRNGSGIHGSVGYTTALYRRETFARFLGIFCGVLEGIAENPEQSLHRLCNR